MSVVQPPPLALSAPHYVAAVAAAILAVLLVWRFRSMSNQRRVIRLAVIAVLVVFATGVTQGLPSVEHVLTSLSSTLGKWTYLLVGALAYLETAAFAGFVAPGEVAVIVGGVVAGQGDISITLLIGIVWFCAVAGDATGFYLGRRLGRPFLLKHGARFGIREPQIEQVERYMHNHAGKTIVIGRFIGFVRPLAPFTAGFSGIGFRRFAPFDVIGAGAWATVFCFLGYLFSKHIESVLNYVERGLLIFGWTIAVIVAIVYLVRRFRKPEERAKLSAWLDRQEREHPDRARAIRPLRWFWNRVLVPVARFFSPQFRFAFERFTPGELGLEFTTAAAFVAMSSFGLYFFTDFAVNGANASVLNEINNTAFRIAGDIRSQWLTDIAKAVTQFGSFYVVAPISLVAALLCARRRRFAEAILVALSLAITVAAVGAMKSWADVPRPSGALVHTGGASFPSGHAAYAVMYVTIAIVIERVGGFYGRVALVVAAVLLAIAIGLTRVYLRAHYLTDVLGGFALAVFVATTIAAIALIVLFIRDLRRARRVAGAGKVTVHRVLD